MTAAPAHCLWCGRPTTDDDHRACRRALDPPRYCPECGRRLRVVVSPTSVRASCRDHGDVVAAEDA